MCFSWALFCHPKGENGTKQMAPQRNHSLTPEKFHRFNPTDDSCVARTVTTVSQTRQWVTAGAIPTAIFSFDYPNLWHILKTWRRIPNLERGTPTLLPVCLEKEAAGIKNQRSWKGMPLVWNLEKGSPYIPSIPSRQRKKKYTEQSFIVLTRKFSSCSLNR